VKEGNFVVAWECMYWWEWKFELLNLRVNKNKIEKEEFFYEF
jgi:hypothetical protein